MWRRCYGSGALRKTLLMTTSKSCSIPGTCLHPSGTGLRSLKGADAAVADVLVAAASAADCDLHLALVSITESGSAEHIGYYGSRRRRWSDEEDEEDFEVSEVHDRHETLSTGGVPTAASRHWGTCPLWRTNSVRPMLEDLEPDEQYFHEATGNEGASFEHLPPGGPGAVAAARRLAVLNQAGLRHSALPGRTGRALDSKWRRRRIALWREAHELSGHMLRAWPRQVGWYPGRTETRSDAATLLTLLSQPAGYGAYRHFSGHPRRWCLQQGRQRGDRAGRRSLAAGAGRALLEHLIASQAATNLSACGDLLARSVAARVTGRAADLSRAATALVEALPGDPARTPRRDPWRRSPPWNPASSLTS